MQETYFLGGYYLIAGTRRQTWMNSSLLPAKLYSVSTCISQHHPDSLLPWVEDRESKLENYRSQLGLDRVQFQALRTKVSDWFDRGQYGWEGVWIDLKTVREFAKDYLSQIKDLKLIAIATTAKYRHEFLLDYDAKLGVDRVLRSGQTIEIDRGFLGYEILGYEHGSFCSFICNHLEADLKQKLRHRTKSVWINCPIQSGKRRRLTILTSQKQEQNLYYGCRGQLSN